MPMSDTDIELLEGHLDGELSSSEDQALCDRLSSDHELATELAAMRADRALRAEVFELFEPDDATVRNLVLSVRKQVTKEAVWGDRLRIIRYITSAAAVVMISFFAGWLGKGTAVPNNKDPQAGAMLAQRTDGVGNFDGVQSNGGTTSLVGEFAHPAAPAAENQQAGRYQVNLTDPFGRVLAVQHFNSLDEASEFRDDLNRWQKQQQQQAHTAENVVYKEQF